MTHHWAMDNTCVKYYSDPIGNKELLLWHRFWVYVHCDLDLGDMNFGPGHDTLLSHGQQLCEILFRSSMASKNNRLYTNFWCVHCVLDLGDMTLSQGYDTQFGHGEQVCEIFSRSNLAVRSYHSYADFGYLFTVTLEIARYDLWSRSWHTLGSWTTIVWNIIQIEHGGEWFKVMAQTRRDRRTVRQTGRFL